MSVGVFNRWVQPGSVPAWVRGAERPVQVFVQIQTAPRDQGREGLRLSITGVVGPRANGDAYGSCGQCVHALREIESGSVNTSGGWTLEDVEKLRQVWERWHLNDMRAGCEHQRAWDVSRKVEVVSYGLTSEAYRLRERTRSDAAAHALKGEPFEPDATARALAELEDWFRDIYTPPDADSPLSGCYEVKRREQKAVGWVRPYEHPEGLLCRPCEVCGYRYGSAWLYEEVPQEVLAWLVQLPDARAGVPSAWLR